MNTYLIMKKKELALFSTEAEPHMIVPTIKEAKNRCKEFNQKAISNRYWYVKVKNSLLCM